MFNRRKLDRERLEIYLLYLLLASRPIFWISGVLFLIYALLLVFWYLPAAVIAALLALYLVLLASSHRTALYTARLGAWIATLRLSFWKRED